MIQNQIKIQFGGESINQGRDGKAFGFFICA